MICEAIDTVADIDVKRCAECGLIKSVHRFSFKVKDRGWRSSYCDVCSPIIGKRKRQKILLQEKEYPSHKKCLSCKEIKPASFFPKKNGVKSGLGTYCKMCTNEKNSISSLKSIDKEKIIPERKICPRCKIDKLSCEFGPERRRKDGLSVYCRECARKESKVTRRKNPEKELAAKSKKRAKKNNATPEWLTKKQLKEIQELYFMSRILKEFDGIEYDVDHIHPLMGENFSGLHVPWNLRVFPRKENNIKNNKPPKDELDLFWSPEIRAQMRKKLKNNSPQL